MWIYWLGKEDKDMWRQNWEVRTGKGLCNNLYLIFLLKKKSKIGGMPGH